MSENRIYNVSELNIYIKNLFEGDIFLSRVYIKGEVTNLNKHYTGHYYFSLKDENSKISCTMFSTYINRLKNDIKNGDQVLVFGKVSVYDKLGTYQIYVYNIEPYGLGQYLLKLEELKRKLQSEGLFDRPKKRINQYPKEIAVVSSKSGAAVQDIKHAITSRWNCLIKVYPCLVQGEEAPKSIINQLSLADSSNADTIILARGGGANEDLKAFNDESLIRYCANLKKPLISAIGHQIDTSIVDLVSDLYCITPTEAGVKSCASKDEINYRLDNCTFQAKKLIQSYLDNKQNYLLQLNMIMDRNNPIHFLKDLKNQVENCYNSAKYLFSSRCQSYLKQIDLIQEKINGLNPKLMLQRGYSIIYQDQNKVDSIKNVKVDDKLTLKVKDGQIKVLVKEIEEYGK